MRFVPGYTEEEGQATLALLFVAVATLAVAALLYRVAAVADQAAGAQNAADAAALAAAAAAVTDLESGFLTTGETATGVETPSARAAAADYAERNGARLVGFETSGMRVFVTVEMSPDGGASALGAPLPQARAAAEVEPEFTAALPDTASRSLTPADLADLERRAGVRVVEGSALLTYGDDCHTGVDVGHLAGAMKVAVIRLEHALGRPVKLTSAYRDLSCQARLFASVQGPVAPPGRSMHNYGLAVDVAEPGAVAAHARAAGLCQPLPATDAVHFALAASRECAGAAGTLVDEPYGGDPGSFVTYDVRLVDEGPA